MVPKLTRPLFPILESIAFKTARCVLTLPLYPLPELGY